MHLKDASKVQTKNVRMRKNVFFLNVITTKDNLRKPANYERWYDKPLFKFPW